MNNSILGKFPGPLAAALSLGLALTFPIDAAQAAAGRAVFVSGTVTAEHGKVRPLAKGDAVEVGDTVITADKSRAQLLMADSARIALRAGSRFRIDTYTLPPTVVSPGAAAVTADGKSGATLLKGGFRTTSGSIGKVDRSAYEVRTPVGTLGIRGTDYVAVFCRGDCADAPGLRPGEVIRDGLYLGVYSGGIVFRGPGIELALDAGQFAFIPFPAGNPEELTTAPSWLQQDGAGPLELGGGKRKTAGAVDLPGYSDRRGPTAQTDGTQDAANSKPDAGVNQPVTGVTPNGPVDLTPGNVPDAGGPRDMALGFPGVPNDQEFPAYSEVHALGAQSYQLDSQSRLTQFSLVVQSGQATVVSIGTSSNVNSGFDGDTGIRWGRWSGGAAQIDGPNGPQTVDLTQGSLHWLLAPGYENGEPPVLPQTGTATYSLVGGTHPTSDTGATGTLTGATLVADFSQFAVTATLDLTINQETWHATGTGGIGGQAGVEAWQFNGGFNVSVNQQPDVGGGNFTGFFSGPNNANGAPIGAGFAYGVSANGTSVNGVVALGTSR